MSGKLAATFRLLTETDTEAAARVLATAWASSCAEIRELALMATLQQQNLRGQREILRRWNSLDKHGREIVKQHRHRMTDAIRAGLTGSDTPLCSQSCAAAAWLKQYEVIPAIASALRDPLHPHSDVLATTLLQLAKLLEYEHGSSNNDGCHHLQEIRHDAVESLGAAVKDYAQHQRQEVIEAFVMLADRDNVLLKHILQNPQHVSFSILTEMLTQSSQSSVIRLLLSFLDAPHAPIAVMAVVGNRVDAIFLRALLRKIERTFSPVVKQNLQQITTLAWLETTENRVAEWNDATQQAAIQLIMASSIPRAQAFPVIKHILQQGKPGGRRAAAEAIAAFTGAEANATVMAALADPDPAVQAAMVAQLRRRKISGTLLRLLKFLESPHMLVRQAARQSLSEFSFKRFLSTFDMLDDDLRRSTGLLVKKTDPQTIPLLLSELCSATQTRRLRGLTIARTIDAVEAVEPMVMQLLQDEDHRVRIEAAHTLQSAHSASRHAVMREALSKFTTSQEQR